MFCVTFGINSWPTSSPRAARIQISNTTMLNFGIPNISTIPINKINVTI